MVTETRPETVPAAGREPVAQDIKTGRFLPGNNGGPGRPRKGESVLEQTEKVVERKSKRVAEAHLKRMLRPDNVGNRAWESYRDTYYGVPKQTLVVQQADSGLVNLLTELAQLGALPGVVDGEVVSRETLPAGEVIPPLPDTQTGPA